jgi:hypothetical protein
MRSRISGKLAGLLLLLLTATTAFAQEDDGGSMSAEDLAKKAQNPVANLISLPLQNNMVFGEGPDDRVRNTLNIQPVWPFELNDKWNLITRTILPVISAPAPGMDRTNGIGDLSFTAFFSPVDSGDWTWGVGPVLLFPTASDEVLGTDRYSAGPSFVALTTPGPWVIGALVSNVWDYAGSSGGSDVNFFTFQYFINYNFPSGWYLTSAPINTANWNAPSGEEWTIPIGGGGGKLVKIGKQPVNFNTQVFYYLESPTMAGDWEWRFQAQLLFPK